VPVGGGISLDKGGLIPPAPLDKGGLIPPAPLDKGGAGRRGDPTIFNTHLLSYLDPNAFWAGITLKILTAAD
jgi:hypothetical protein